MKISVKCPNCLEDNTISTHDLLSGMPIKNDQGEIVEEFPEVEVDENTLIQCSNCKYPVSCANPTILE